MSTHQEAVERYKAIYDMRASGQPVRDLATALHISLGRVRQILAKYEQILKAQREMRESPDLLLRALGNGCISRKVYNSLVRGGYGKTFDFDDLVSWLRSDTFNPQDFRYFGQKSVEQLRGALLSQDERNAIASEDRDCPRGQ